MNGIAGRVEGRANGVARVDDREDPSTTIRFFGPKDTVSDVLIAAAAVERMGHFPELRFGGNSDDPELVELFVADVPSLALQLRDSIARNGKENGQ